MKKIILVSLLLLSIAGCYGDTTTGFACLGKNNDTLVEFLDGVCKKGDAIVTKFPAYFCNFNYAVAFNDFNSAFCIYIGEVKPERVELK